MQRKPEDRVFPYNSQICLIREISSYIITISEENNFKYKCINHRQHNIPCYYVAILGSTNKAEISRIGNWISVMSRGKGQAPLRVRDTLANASGLRTRGNPWIGWAGPLLRLRIGNS